MLVTTIHGEMDEAALEKKEGVIDNEDEYTTWVEYRLGDDLVHRSAHVTLKKMPTFADGTAAGFGF